VAEPVRNLVFACIAKNPADRPASAAHLARSAQALRRGDVAAAAAAVPAVLGATGLTGAATVLMPSPAAGATQATTVLPSAARATTTTTTTEEDAQPSTTKKRSPWTWPLIALIALLALVLIGTIIALVAQPQGTPKPTQTTSSSKPTTPPPAPKPTPTPTSNTVAINEADYTGLSADDARAKLQAAGMVADVQTGNAATSAPQVNTVYSVNPTGPVPRGSKITLKVYGPVAPIPTPTDTVTTNPSSPQALATPPTQITVTFGSASCPAGQNLVGRRLYIDGAPQTPVNANSTTWAPTAANTYNLSYTIFCGQSVESAQSPTTPYQITPAATGGGGNSNG